MVPFTLYLLLDLILARFRWMHLGGEYIGGLCYLGAPILDLTKSVIKLLIKRGLLIRTP